MRREMRGERSLAIAATAASALAAVLLVSFQTRSPTVLVRAPGDSGVGGHGIGGQICWYEINEESGLGEWTCPTTENTLAAARGMRRPVAQMLKVEIEKYGAAGCNYEYDDAAMRGGWTCPPTEDLPSYVPPPLTSTYFTAARHDTRPPRRAKMAHAPRVGLFDFGDRAPAGGYASAYGALPPMTWGDNYDGKNFVAFYPEEQDFTGASS